MFFLCFLAFQMYFCFKKGNNKYKSSTKSKSNCTKLSFLLDFNHFDQKQAYTIVNVFLNSAFLLLLGQALSLCDGFRHSRPKSNAVLLTLQRFYSRCTFTWRQRPHPLVRNRLTLNFFGCKNFQKTIKPFIRKLTLLFICTPWG